MSAIIAVALMLNEVVGVNQKKLDKGGVEVKYGYSAALLTITKAHFM